MIAITEIDRAFALTGKIVTDGTIMGVLDVVEGRNWSTSQTVYGPKIHDHSDNVIEEYAQPHALVINSVDDHVIPFAKIRLGVTLRKITDH